MSELRTRRYFADWDEGLDGFRSVYPARIHFTTVARAELVHEVDVHEVGDDIIPTHYGWEATGTAPDAPFPWGLIQRSMVLLSICFPDGVESAIKTGRGRVVRLVVEAVSRDEPARAPRGGVRCLT